MTNDRRGTFKFVAIPTLIVLFLAIYPQLNMWMVKGSAWQGSYVVSNYDEVAYSAYINALIDGRPRKTDPFTGVDNVEYESLYSIQFVPAYAIALPARIFGYSASTAFVLLNFLIPIFASLAIFFLLFSVTGDRFLSAVGVVTALCLGAMAAFQGELQLMTLGNYLTDFFPYVRRYQPGFTFPLFFVFCMVVWRMFTSDNKRTAILLSLLASLILVILVFSYFYLWTAALAWLGCFAVLWMIFRPDDRGRTILNVGIICVAAVAALIPYALLLSNRPQNMDDAHSLVYTRMPDLLAVPEVIGFIIAAILIFLARKKKLRLTEPIPLLVLSMSLTPFVLFNQQVLTGRSLQPVHYEMLLANYLVLAAMMLLIFLIGKAYSSERSTKTVRTILIYLGVAAVLWGIVESTATGRRNAAYESLRDDAMPVLTYLKGQQAADAAAGKQYAPVLSTNLMVADFIPTVTSYRALWSPHTESAGGVNLKENKELFHKYLYLSGYDEKDVAQAIDENLFELMAAFFGGGRALTVLKKGAVPISQAEMRAELKSYSQFRNEFNASHAAKPEISYMIVTTAAEPDYEKLDQWYQRDEGKTFGLFKIYKLQLKPQQP